MPDFTVKVTKVARDDSHTMERWVLEGTLLLAGDLYEFMYEHEVGEYGGGSLDVTLDGVEQGDDTFFARSLGHDALYDAANALLSEVWDAGRRAQQAAVDTLLAMDLPGNVNDDGEMDWTAPSL